MWEKYCVGMRIKLKWVRGGPSVCFCQHGHEPWVTLSTESPDNWRTFSISRTTLFHGVNSVSVFIQPSRFRLILRSRQTRVVTFLWVVNCGPRNAGSETYSGTDTVKTYSGTDTAKTYSGTDTAKPYSGTDTAKTYSGTDTAKTYSGTDTAKTLKSCNCDACYNCHLPHFAVLVVNNHHTTSSVSTPLVCLNTYAGRCKRNLLYFGRMFLKLIYIGLTKHTWSEIGRSQR
jgi:hypothetical protein